MDLMEFWLDSMRLWAIGVPIIALLAAWTGTIVIDTRVGWARMVLVFAVAMAATPVWPLFVVAALTLVIAWAVPNAELEIKLPKRLPREERRRIKRELATAMADKQLDEILAENDLKRHVGRD